MSFAPPVGAPPPASSPPSVDALLRGAVEEAARLLGADGAFLYLLDAASGRLRFRYDAGLRELAADSPLRRLELEVGVGMFGKSVAERRVVVTGDYQGDRSFVHASGPDRFVDEVGISSLVVAPLVAGDEVFGALGAFARTGDAFTAPQVALVRALADHAALAMANARIIEELGRSREALARQAVEEHALREIAARLATIGDDPAEVLQRIVDESARLLCAERARLDLVEQTAGRQRWSHPTGREQPDPWIPPGDPAYRTVGLSALAAESGRAVTTPDYAADERFVHYPEGDAEVREQRLRSVVAAPVFGEGVLLGMLQLGSSVADAFGDEHVRLIESLADQAAIAIGNARLVDRLAGSQAELARAAEAEHALREIAGRMMTIQDPADLLGHVVAEAARLMGSSGAVIDLLDPATGRISWAHDAGVDPAIREAWTTRGVGDGGVFTAIRERRVVVSDDYGADTRFADGPPNAAFLRDVGVRAVAFAPLVGEAAVLGTLSVFSDRVASFGEAEAERLGALASQAAIAIRNAELIRALGQSREETARRADTERALREIAARITSERDPDAILGLIVDEAQRILESDGAHLTRFSEDRTYVLPVVVSGGMDEETRAWLRTQEFPINGGINGLAAGGGRLVWTADYESDPRIPRDADDLEVARRMGLGAMAAAPLREPGGEVIGTLAVSYREPGPIPEERLAILQALADNAAIALSNSDLLARLEASEGSYRRLVQATPDVIWRNDADGRFTFLAERVEALFGRRAEELIGEHFAVILDPESLEDADRAWSELARAPDRIWRLRFCLRRRDGTSFPAEVSAVSIFEDGRFAGGQGTLRDVSERERLERELRESEERYRFLVENSPDVVFSADAEGRLTYVSETVERLIEIKADELVGQPFAMAVTPETLPAAMSAWEAANADPLQGQVFQVALRHRAGGSVPVEAHSVGVVDASGRFAGVHGSVRDVSERERLERELRESEERYRSLVQSSPDLIWATNRQGRYVFVSDRVPDLLGWAPEDILGHHFTEFVAPESVPAALAERDRLNLEPNRPQTQRLDLLHRDGSHRPFEVSTVAVSRDAELEAIYGIARDVTERERLERELRESEERYRFLVENSPEIVYATDADGRFTYVSDSIEKSLGWIPAEFIGRHFSDLVAPRGSDPVGRSFRQLAEDPTGEVSLRMELRAADGTGHPFDVSGVAIVRDGQFAGVHGSARDVGERARLERELRESEERYRYLVQSSPDLVWMTDDEGRFTFISDQVRAIVGWEPSDLIGTSFEELAPPAERRSTRARFRMLRRRPTTVHRSRVPVLHRDGRRLAMEISGIGMQDEGRFVGAHGAARDVSERERLERDLRRQAAELAASEERSHLARELHDSVTQALFSMTLLSRSIEILLGRDPDQVPGKLAALRELQRDALAEMRALIFELRPGNIEEHGLIQSLRTHVAALAGRIGLPIVVEADLPDRPSIEVEEALYRIAQEALHNVVKHAGAHQVRVEVGRVASGVQLRVIDDGRGFDPGVVAAGSLGLAGMRARAERLGGRLAVHSVPGDGTTIEVVLPDGPPASGSPSAPAVGADELPASVLAAGDPIEPA